MKIGCVGSPQFQQVVSPQPSEIIASYYSAFSIGLCVLLRSQQMPTREEPVNLELICVWLTFKHLKHLKKFSIYGYSDTSYAAKQPEWRPRCIISFSSVLPLVCCYFVAELCPSLFVTTWTIACQSSVFGISSKILEWIRWNIFPYEIRSRRWYFTWL